MASAPLEKKIKSADRVLEIFEMFNERRTAVTVMDVARALNAPQSSTSELLGSLVRRGYLVRERGARMFRPTARVALLGAWVHPALFRNGTLLKMMDNLREQTGLGVVLSSMVGISLQHVHTVGELPEEMLGESGCRLLHSPFGHVILSMKFSQEVRLLVQRINAECDPEVHVLHKELSERLLAVSKRGVAVDEVVPGWSAIAVLLPQAVGEEQLSIGIVGRTSEIEGRRDELLRSLRQAISGYLGPRLASKNFVPAPLIAQEAVGGRH